MQHLSVPALFAGLIACGPVLAGPLALTPPSYWDTAPAARLSLPLAQSAQPSPESPPTQSAPVRTAAVESFPLGGGFLELLFRGPASREAVQPRSEAYYGRQPYGEAAYPEVDSRFLPQEVLYSGREQPGTIIINTNERMLYLVQSGGRAVRYGIGVGRPGFTWSGVHHVTAKREWPEWRPPEQMLRRRPDLPHYMPGGPDNPLGARAMYLGSTLYRIHGSNEPWTIGTQVSSGCIRMRNEDVVDLYGRVKVGTKVIVI